MSPLDLPPFQALLRERCGLAFEQQSADKLASALSTRMQARGLRLPNAYLAQVRGDPAELQTLINLLTVNETYFFREPEQLRLLVERLIPRLLQQRWPPGQGQPGEGQRAARSRDAQAPSAPPAARLRLLSAGCSSGEEVYSLIMRLAEVHGARTPALFEVIGGDIDSAILAKARAGRYGRFSFRGVSLERQQAFFTASAGGFAVADWIRDQARFIPLNLSAPPADLGSFDVILYRNVSIYFDAPTRERVLRHLTRLLNPNGYLIVGTSETHGNDLGLLELRQEDGLFYFVNRSASTQTRTQGFAEVPTNAPIQRPPSQASRLHPGRAANGIPADPPAGPPADTSLHASTQSRLGAPGGACSDTSANPAESTPVAAPAPRPSADHAGAADAPTDSDHQPLPIPPIGAIEALIREQRFDEALTAVAACLASSPADTDALLLESYLRLERRQFDAAERRARQVLAHSPWLIDAWLLLGLTAKWRGNYSPLPSRASPHRRADRLTS